MYDHGWCLHRGLYTDSMKLDKWRVLLPLPPCAGLCLCYCFSLSAIYYLLTWFFIYLLMIFKRYQYISREGIKWTPWSNYCEDDSQLSRLQKEEKYQLKPHLLNEFRIV